MPLFRRRRPDPPAWAGFFDADAWHEFSELVRYEAGRRRWSQDLPAGLVADGDRKMGLGNLAQTCHGSPPDEWTEIVARHFVTLDDTRTTTFLGPEEALAALRARLIDDEYLSATAFAPAVRQVADDLRLVLAYDLPTHVTLPSREEVLEWGGEDELFELALEQTRAETGQDLERFDAGDGSTIWAFTGESFFTATHALWIDTLLPPPPEHGTLVAVPNRHTVVFHPIRDGSVVDAVSPLIRVTNIAWNEGPGSLSKSLYWLRDGRLECQPTSISGANTWLVPSDELLEVLNDLE